MRLLSHKCDYKVTLSFNYIIYLCLLLACFVPRYISVFKVRIGIELSYYTIAVMIVWLISTRSIVIYKPIEYSFFSVWAIFIVFGIWRAKNIGVWAFYASWIMTAILLQQIIRKYQDESTYDFIVKALTDALFVHLLIGLYETTAHRYLFEIGTVSMLSYGHVAVGIFYNLNDYSTFVTTMLPFAIYRLLDSCRIIEKAYCLFLIIASIHILLLNASRGSIWTLIVLVCVGIVLFARKSKRNMLFTCGGICVVGFLLANDSWRIFSTLAQLIRRYAIDITNSSDIARINLIRNGLYFLKKTHGFGVGAGNLYTWLEEKSVYYIGQLRFIHNWYLEVLVTFGIPFFIIYILFHVRLIYKLFFNNYEPNKLKNTMLLSFVCFSIVSISSSSNIYSEWVWMYFVVVSMFSLSLKKREVSIAYSRILRFTGAYYPISPGHNGRLASTSLG